MVMAGLLEQSTRRLRSGLPGLRQLPVLGQLFRSEEFENEESELVILVTPYLVKPGQPEDFKLPTDGFSPGSDIDIFLLGKLHATYGTGRVKPETAQRALQAPFGYIME
jgi:pilus assembly protein CpaC